MLRATTVSQSMRRSDYLTSIVLIIHHIVMFEGQRANSGILWDRDSDCLARKVCYGPAPRKSRRAGYRSGADPPRGVSIARRCAGTFQGGRQQGSGRVLTEQSMRKGHCKLVLVVGSKAQNPHADYIGAVGVPSTSKLRVPSLAETLGIYVSSACSAENIGDYLRCFLRMPSPEHHPFPS